MSSAKTLAVLALSTLSGLATAVAPSFCTAIGPAPDDFSCGKVGSISNPSSKVGALERLSFDECANWCGTNDYCAAFKYVEVGVGRCEMYNNALADLGFTDDENNGEVFYDVGCFDCYANALVDVDFTSPDSVSDWSLTSDPKGSFYLDHDTIAGQPVFLIIGNAASGSAITTYAPTFQLEADASYKLEFKMRTSLPTQTDLSLLTFGVATDDEVVFEYSPEGGVQVADWTIYTAQFTIQAREAGEGSLLFKMDASMLPLNWYFSYIYLQPI